MLRDSARFLRNASSFSALTALAKHHDFAESRRITQFPSLRQGYSERIRELAGEAGRVRICPKIPESRQQTRVSRSYPGIVSDQTAQNYDTLVLGDVAAPFVEP